MSRKKSPRKNIGSRSDLSGKTNLQGQYYGQPIPTGKEQDDLYSQLLGLGSGLPGTMGSGSGSAGSGSGSASSTSNPAWPTAMGTALHGIYGKGSSYIDMLNGAYGNSELIQLLKSLGNNYGKGLTNGQASDWNKQLLDMILQQYANQEQRAYDRSVLDEQRLYDNPLNQLARLMGAGISRDAAIQMLSGTGSGAGGSSGLIGSAANPISTGIAPSESYANQVAAGTAIANTVFGGLSALSGLVGLGFSVPQAIQQTRYLQNQNALTQRQLSAYDSTGRAFSILNTAGAAAESFGSVASAAAAITELAKKGNSDATQFIASGGLQAMKDNAPFSSQTLNQLYRSERASTDYDKQFVAEIANEWAKHDLSVANKDNLVAQIRLYDSQIDNLVASTEYQEGLTDLLVWQRKLLGKQADYYQAQTDAQKLSNNLESAFQSGEFEGKTGVEWFTSQRMNDLYVQVHALSEQKDKQLWTKQVERMLSEEETLASMYALQKLYYDGTIASVTASDKDSRDLLYFCNACQDCGLFSYISAAANAETAGHVNSPYFGKSLPSESGQDLIELVSDKGKKKKGLFH